MEYIVFNSSNNISELIKFIGAIKLFPNLNDARDILHLILEI